MAEQKDEDLSWLDEGLRQSALEMLDVLFASSRVSVITFDADGTIVGVNPHTSAFDGRAESPYRGVNLLSNLVVRRLGWSEAIRRVLQGESVELTDTRWVTLFSREERYVDAIAGPVVVNNKVIGGIVYLIDSTKRHRADLAALANRRRARELEAFLARDVSQLIGALEEWSRREPPDSHETAIAMGTIEELSMLLDDLMHFIQLETYQPVIERVLLSEVVDGLAKNTVSALKSGRTAVLADRRLLRRVLRTLAQFSTRNEGRPWTVCTRDGRVHIEMPIERPPKWLQSILLANSASTAEADSARDSLAAARWMTEALHGDLAVARDGRDSLLLNLPAADPELAVAGEPAH